MKTAALLIFLVSHQGYWLSGQEQTITVQWVAKENMPPADLIWELGFGTVKLAGGTVAINADLPAKVTFKAPEVRVRASLRWAYRLVQRDGNKLLDNGELPIFDFPGDLTQDWPDRLQDKAGKSSPPPKLLVWDDADGLPKILDSAKVPFTRVRDLSNVLDRPDVILVSADSIDDSVFSQAPLVDLAKAGASVAVLKQARPNWLIGYALARRDLPTDIRFKAGHPLFARLSPDDLRSWVDGAKGPLWAVQLPTDEPALELAWWPRESAGGQPAPIDALIATKTFGPGRIVLCQVPLGPWGQDPRSQIFLGNLLSYLSTRPEPTPAAGERHEEQPPLPQTVPTIPLGANP